MNVYIESENKKIEVKEMSSVKQLLKHLKINPETVIITKNGELATDDTRLYNKDRIKILSVVSGG